MVKVKRLVSLRRLSPRTHHLFPKTRHFFPKIADQIASQTPSLCLSLLVTNPSSHIPNKLKMKMETKNADHPPPFRRSQITKIQGLVVSPNCCLKITIMLEGHNFCGHNGLKLLK
ncbi:uncharacterized protein LOC114274769 [Camellia sinensis]|uniref:uncharacterized protein LOC114274769 n=1 Tax=Camellia sinensis TaxID=4442 RepID=UPI001035DF5C|nr:uncharacterized protein LOC114274769 [Camellia sinensis]